MVHRHLTAMLTPTLDQDRFLTCLFYLSRPDSGYPPITDDYVSRVLFMLPSVHGQFKVRCCIGQV